MPHGIGPRAGNEPRHLRVAVHRQAGVEIADVARAQQQPPGPENRQPRHRLPARLRIEITASQLEKISPMRGSRTSP